MSKSLHEFQRFLQKTKNSLSEYEKRLAKIILDNYPYVESSGTAGGRRGKLIAKLIVETRDIPLAELRLESEASEEQSDKILRLSSIAVENFRGFSDKQTFDFSKPYTFVYGPNGTGKSSLCEALEYSLVGTISEAATKRIDVDTYIKNSISKKSSAPLLLGKTTNEPEVKVIANQQKFEFCFIEKNRIDGFARVAANTTSAQQTRLASLFGLEEFNAFATQFNDNFDTYIDCIGKRTKELSEKEKQVAGEKAVLLGIPKKEAEIKTREKSILLKYPTCAAMADVKIYISGADGNGGLYKENNKKISRFANSKEMPNPATADILNEAANLIDLIQERRSARQFISEYKDQLCLGELYLALIKNKENNENACPACESILYKDETLLVPVNPYVNAAEKLKKFEIAINNEARSKEIAILLKDRWTPLSLKIANLIHIAMPIKFSGCGEIQIICDDAANVHNAKSLEDVLIKILSKATLLHSLKFATDTFNGEVGKSKAAIKAVEGENSELTKQLEEIIAIRTIVEQLQLSVVSAKSTIEKFNLDNNKLIRQVAEEKLTIERNTKYAESYSSFREKLLRYNADLPLTLAADLNAKTLKYYNAINKRDHISDRLKSITLPTITGKKIDIEFTNGQRCDALQILSEGHIRCLGLAILLAKIVRDDLPFLIFDDVVNSIDDEHRSGIIELILGDDEIKTRQLIITTHGEDFVKRLENFIPKAEYGKTVGRIDFLVPSETKKINVKLNLPRHYLVVAEQSFDDGKMRDCLSYVRKSFEELLNRLWKKTSSKSHAVQIKVSMRVPNGNPDLMSIASGMHDFLSKKEVSIYQNLLPPLERIIGRESRHPVEWSYLNKGTHEDEKSEEFDSTVVREMLDIVMEMDSLIT